MQLGDKDVDARHKAGHDELCGPSYFFFFAPFLAAAGAAATGASVSGTLPIVMIWICWVTGEAGRAWSLNCSSPTPSDIRGLDDILIVSASTSRIAAARVWLRITLAGRLPWASVWPTI